MAQACLGRHCYLNIRMPLSSRRVFRRAVAIDRHVEKECYSGGRLNGETSVLPRDRLLRARSSSTTCCTMVPGGCGTRP